MALPTLGHIELRRLSASDLDALHDGMRASGSAPATIHKVHGTICRALNQVVLGERERGQPPPPA